MEVSKVKKKDEECVRRHLKQMLSAYNVADIRYFAEKRTLVVSFADYQAVDGFLERTQSFRIGKKKYFIKKHSSSHKNVSCRLEESSLKLLDKIGFCQITRARYRDITIDLDFDRQIIRFDGAPADVDASAEKMQQILSRSTEKIYKASADMLNLFDKSNIREIVDDHLKQNKLADTVVWYCKHSEGVCVRGVDVTSTRKALAIILGQVVQTRIFIDADSERLLSSPNWVAFCNNIIKKHQNNLALNKPNSECDGSGSVLKLCCRATDCKSIKKEIECFLLQHTVRKDFIGLHSLAVQFITKFMNGSVIKEIQDLHSSNYVQLQPISQQTHTSEKTGFEISGNRESIVYAKRKLLQLITHEIRLKQHTVVCPGADKYFKSDDAVLLDIGNRTRTIIRVTSDANKNLELHMDDSRVQTGSQFSLPCGTKLYVLEGDIVHLNCDAIIIPTNGQLQHVGGLASIIAEKGGQTVLDECAAFTKTHGPPSDCQVVVTAAGILPCKKIIHAVGPQWQGGMHNEENMLFITVQNALAASAKHGLTRIAIPPISAGAFNYPLKENTRTIVTSVIEFCNYAVTSLREIFFIDNTTDGAMLFKQSVEQLVNETSESADPAYACDWDSFSISALTSSISALTTSTAQQGNNDEYVLETRNDKLPSITLGNVTVELIEGSLLKQQVVVMINSVGSELRLNAGGLSKVLAEAAGPDMQIYLNTKFPDGLAAGKVAVSEGFQLPCKFVFHGCCSQWDNGRGKSILHELLRTSLNLAEECRMSSIAIPAIGTGLLGFPPQESAKITYEAVLDFCRTHSNCSLSLIRIVVLDTPVAAYKMQHVASLRAEKEKCGASSAEGNIQGVLATMSFSLKLNICGTGDHILKAIEAIDLHCDTNVRKHALGDKNGYWSTLSNAQVDDIVKKCTDEGVEFAIDPRNRCITLRSLDFSAARNMRLLIKVLLKNQGNLTRFKWQFRDGKGQWQNYEPCLNALLESAFQAGQPSVDYNSPDGKAHMVNFRDKTSCIKDNSCVGVEVQRVDKRQQLPDGWTNAPKDIEEVLREGSLKYDEVKSSFFRTSKGTPSIIEIKRVQNLTLLRQYELQMDKTKENMDASSTRPVERWLWHGTDIASLEKICKTGFNRSYCGVNGTVYGQGVYFARDSSYSANDTYSKPSGAGVKHMIYCRVLTGEFELGMPHMRTPSPRKNANKANYDTTVDDISNPSIFVIYHDAQAYPAYIVTFK